MGGVHVQCVETGGADFTRNPIKLRVPPFRGQHPRCPAARDRGHPRRGFRESRPSHPPLGRRLHEEVFLGSYRGVCHPMAIEHFEDPFRGHCHHQPGLLGDVLSPRSICDREQWGRDVLNDHSQDFPGLKADDGATAVAMVPGDRHDQEVMPTCGEIWNSVQHGISRRNVSHLNYRAYEGA